MSALPLLSIYYLQLWCGGAGAGNPTCFISVYNQDTYPVKCHCYKSHISTTVQNVDTCRLTAFATVFLFEQRDRCCKGGNTVGQFCASVAHTNPITRGRRLLKTLSLLHVCVNQRSVTSCWPRSHFMVRARLEGGGLKNRKEKMGIMLKSTRSLTYW